MMFSTRFRYFRVTTLVIIIVNDITAHVKIHNTPFMRTPKHLAGHYVSYYIYIYCLCMVFRNKLHTIAKRCRKIRTKPLFSYNIIEIIWNLNLGRFVFALHSTPASQHIATCFNVGPVRVRFNSLHTKSHERIIGVEDTRPIILLKCNYTL